MLMPNCDTFTLSVPSLTPDHRNFLRRPDAPVFDCVRNEIRPSTKLNFELGFLHEFSPDFWECWSPFLGVKSPVLSGLPYGWLSLNESSNDPDPGGGAAPAR